MLASLLTALTTLFLLYLCIGGVIILAELFVLFWVGVAAVLHPFVRQAPRPVPPIVYGPLARLPICLTGVTLRAVPVPPIVPPALESAV
jgi:hypothetical protein